MLGWRDVPVRPQEAGRQAQLFAPVIRQLFVAAADDVEVRSPSSGSST